MKAPQQAYVQLGTQSVVRVAPRTLPVVFVPDIFGTRLSPPDDDALVWNPQGSPFGQSPGGFTIKLAELMETHLPLIPAERSRPDSARVRDETRHIAHFDGLVTDTYKPLVTRIADHDTDIFKDHDVQVRVFCCGYDWRQDNARSALRLAEVVDEATRETGERKVVIVAHGMGGHVARYYCAALGGESRVLRMILLGAPTLGSTDAYTTLKDGIGGLYAKEYFDRCAAGDARGVAVESARVTVEVIQAAVAASQGGSFLNSLFGGLYSLLCLATGRHLPRHETRAIARHFPSLYQLLPNATFCRSERTWLVFDPMATGQPLSGYMVVMPSMLESTAWLTTLTFTGSPATADQVAAGVRRALDAPSSEEGEVASARASRNVDTLAGLLQKVALAFNPHSMQDVVTASGAGVRLGRFASRMFMDCGSPLALYRDPYTGLLDEVSERPLCAAWLAQAHQFDRALTRDPFDEPPLTGIRAVMGLVNAIGASPVGAAIGQWAAGQYEAIGADWSSQRATFEADFRGANYQQRFDELERRRRVKGEQRQREASDREAAAQEDRDARRDPLLYLHPATISIYGTGSAGSPAGVLVPLRAVSFDDTNVVRSMLAPFPGMVEGDGTVSRRSAAPEDAEVSSPLFSTAAITDGTHANLLSQADTFSAVADALDAVIPSFLKS